MSRLRAFAALTLVFAGVFSPSRAEQTKAPEAPKTAIQVKEIARGLQNPWSLQFLPDGRMLVTERPGRMRLISMDGKVSDPIEGLPHVVNKEQGGLLDVLLAQDFAASGLIFFSYSEPRGGFANGTAVVRAKLVLEGGNGKIQDGEVIFRQEPPARSFYHFGSRLVWDKTGALFVTLGERADLSEGAQDLGTHLGKVIRILPDGSAPKDNPFESSDDKRPEIWSYGHRNVQGAALDPNTGRLWTTEHGAMGGDELNHPEAGKNYGWPVIAYGINYDGKKIGDGISKKDGMEQPVYYWKPSIGTSGLAFYNADLFKGWKGNLLAGGLSGQRLERLVLDGDKVVAVEHLLVDRHERIRDVRVAHDGAVFVLIDDDKDGKVLRLRPGE